MGKAKGSVKGCVFCVCDERGVGCVFFALDGCVVVGRLYQYRRSVRGGAEDVVEQGGTPNGRGASCRWL